jgi:single-stranded-DNA-specific exonuclease
VPPEEPTLAALRLPPAALQQRLASGVSAADLDPAAVRADAVRLGLHPVAAALLRARGVVDPAAQTRWLRPRLADLHRPEGMAGFEPAVDLLLHAQRSGGRVAIFGDYDVDGVSTTAVLSAALEGLGVEVVPRVAHRDRGYGFTVEDAQALLEARPTVVLTGDCGTSDVEALGLLHTRGVPTVVIDHHQVPERAPPCAAMLNPHQPGCEFPFKGLCSAGVAFYLAAALRTAARRAGRPEGPDPKLALDLVALGTIVDMVPLVEDNRILVKHGLERLGRRERPGVRALLTRAGDESDAVDEETVGFQLGPRLNAPGRFGAADPSLQLLRAQADVEADALAEQIEAINTRRKAHQAVIEAQALALLEAEPHVGTRAGLVVAHDEWLPGVVGIVANALMERFARPVVVLAIDREAQIAKGSVRTCGRVDVVRALRACAGHVLRAGGHPAAAGVTLALDQLDAFAAAFAAAVADQLGAAPRAALAADEVAPTWHDGLLRLADVEPELLAGLAAVGPFGQGFAPPLWWFDDLRVDSAAVVGKGAQRFTWSQAGRRLEGIAFGQGDKTLHAGERVGVLARPTWNVYRGKARLQLRVARWWRL